VTRSNVEAHPISSHDALLEPDGQARLLTHLAREEALAMLIVGDDNLRPVAVAADS